MIEVKRPLTILIVFVILFSILTLSVSANSDNVTYESILGVYEGTYTPSDGVLRGATMLVFMNNNKCQAVFNFYQISGGGSSYSGSYVMDVSINPVSGSISLVGVQWINRPSSYIFADFVVYKNGDQFEGDRISLKKTSTTTYHYSGEHDHLFESELAVVEPTCTENGYTEGRCSICSNLIKNTSEATGHQTIDWRIVDEASCIKIGKEASQCEKCESTVYRETGKLAHQYGNWEISKYSTCTANGVEIRYCTFCDAFEEREILPAGHNYGEWEIVSGNKLIPPIVSQKTCSACGDIQENKDWSNIWITIIALVALIGVGIGVINYIKGIKKSK